MDCKRVTVIGKKPGNLHQKEKALHRNVWCFSFYIDVAKGGGLPQ